MRSFSSGLLSGLNKQYGSDPVGVVRFRERKYGGYDQGDEEYNIDLPTMEGRLSKVDMVRFSVNRDSNTVACDISFEICDTTEAILANVMSLEFSKIDSCMIGIACSGSTSVEYFFKGYLSGPITWNNLNKSFTASFTSDYTKKKIGYIFKGTEVPYPNKAVLGHALPTVFGDVATARSMCIQTGLIGYLPDKLEFTYYNTYPNIYPQKVRVDKLNIPGVLPGQTPSTGTKTYKVYVGGAVAEITFDAADPYHVTFTKIWLETHEHLKLPKIGILRYVNEGRPSTMPTFEGGGWFVENNFIGITMPKYTVSKWWAAHFGDGAQDIVNFAINQVKNLINFHDSWTDVYGTSLITNKKALENPEVPITYLSPIPPEELIRVTNGQWQATNEIVRTRSKYKTIKEFYKMPIELDEESTVIGIAPGTPIILIRDRTLDATVSELDDKTFVPDIYVLNHTTIPDDITVFTGIPAGADETNEVVNTFYKTSKDGIDSLRLIKNKYFAFEAITDYKIAIADKVTFGNKVSATTLTLNVPAILFGGDTVYTDIKSNITQNTAEQIRRILDMNSEFVLNTTSFEETALDVAGYPSCFCLTNDKAKLGAIKICSELAYQSNIGLILCSPEIKAKYLATQTDTVGTISRDDVLEGSLTIEFTSPQDIPTLFVGRWSDLDWVWETDKELKKVVVQLGTPDEAQNEESNDFYIYTKQENVYKSLQYIALQTGYQWATLRITMPAYGLKYEVFDIVSISLPDIEDNLGIITEQAFDLSTCTVELAIKVNLISGDA